MPAPETMQGQQQKLIIVMAASFFGVLNGFRLILLVISSQEFKVNSGSACRNCVPQSTRGNSTSHISERQGYRHSKGASRDLLIASKYGDRIETQLHLSRLSSTRDAYRKYKKILVIDGYPHGVYPGDLTFRHEQCAVDRCILTDNSQFAQDADAVIFQGNIGSAKQRIKKSLRQIWIYYQLESPVHSDTFYKPHLSYINWTATYRRDSTIVTPYAQYVPYSVGKGALGVRDPTEETSKDYAAGKTSDVAWFVSNCVTTNNRMEYARELQHYIKVDIYGDCGDLKCSRTSQEECFYMLRQKYKFYLAFENSSCKDYITEKLFINSLL